MTRGRGRARPLEFEATVMESLVAAWRCRLELALLGVATGVQRLLAPSVGEFIAAVVVVALAAAVMAIAPSRRPLRSALRRASLRRAWARAATDAGLSDGPFRVPRVRSLAPIPAGDVLRVRVLRGQSVGMLDARRAELAACLRVREARVGPDRADAAEACVTLVRRDPFDHADPIAWPAAAAGELSLWESVPVGLDEHGEPVRIGLVERNVLVGGEPGSGKSVALSLLVGAGALDPQARVWLLDGKLVELAAWAPVAERIVGPDGEQAVELLRELQTVMDARYRDLLARGLRKVRREDGLALHLVVCDELAFYLSAPDRKLRQDFAELLRDLVARGRAAGVIVVAATQKPGADIVPTTLRDLFGFRLALRCNTPQASDTILGQGWASAGFDASTIPGGQRGVGLLLAEEDRPGRVKTFHLSDEQIGAIVERAAARGADAWLAATATAERSGS